MAEEDGDQIRVTRLEDRTEDLADEVSTLGGVLKTHMSQVAADKIEAKKENVERYRAMMVKFGDTLEVAQGNSKQLGILVALDKDRRSRTPAAGFFPAMNGKTKVVAGGVLGTGGIMIVLEAGFRFYNWVQGLLP